MISIVLAVVSVSFTPLAGAAQDPAPIPPQSDIRAIKIGERVADALADSDVRSEGGKPERRYSLAVTESGPVTISLESFDFDALLRVESEAGERLAEDDDSGVETDARIVLAADTARAVTIVVSSKEGSGEFALEVRAGEVPLPTGTALLDAGIAWSVTATERALARGDKRSAVVHLREEGRARRSRSQFPEAKAAVEKSLVLARDLGDRAGEGKALGSLGTVYFSLGDYSRAREHFEQCLALSRELGDRESEAKTLGNLGIVYDAVGDIPRARAHYEQWLALVRARGDRGGEARALASLGRIYLSLGDYAGARENEEQSLALARELGDRDMEANALAILGGVYLSLGDYPRARERQEQSVALARERGNRELEANALASLGDVYLRLGDYARAREHLEQSLELARELGARQLEANALAGLGHVDDSLGDYTKAREHLEQSLALARELGDRAGEARALGSLGNVYHSLGDWPRARECIEQCLTFSREMGDGAGEAASLINLGAEFLTIGDYARALAHLEEGLSVALRVGHRPWQANAHANLGNVCWALGDPARAYEHFAEWLALSRELGDRAGEASALGNLGMVHEFLGDYSTALEQYEHHLTVCRELGDRKSEAMALGNLGHAYHSLGDYRRTREYYEQSLALSRELGFREVEAQALQNLGNVHASLGDHLRARELASTADELARELGDRSSRVCSLGTIARSSLSLGDSLAARAAFDEAEGLVAALTSTGLERDQSTALRGKFSWLGTIAQDFAAVRLRDAAGDTDARASVLAWGLAAAGRGKGRALLEGIAEHRAGGRSAEAIALRRERREAIASHAAILERVSKSIHEPRPVEEVEALRSEAGSKLAEAERLAERLREISPKDAALDLPLGVSPEELRSAVLGPRDLLVEYVEGEKRLYAYVLGEGVLEFVDLGASDEITAEQTRFLGGIRDLGSLAGPADVARAGRALFDRLLAPALAATKEPIERLVIVPSASLAALPFEAFVVESASDSPASFAELTFVIDRYETTYGPSSPVLVELASIGPRERGGKVLLLADPRYASEPVDAPVESATSSLLGGQRALPDASTLQRLPKTREEAFAIAERLIGDDAASDVLRLRKQRSGSLSSEHIELHLGSEATRARLAGDLRGYSVVHLACHGFVDPQFPQRSGVALAASETDPGWFTILDTLELDLDANLVVLSACETARGEPKAGEGVESLARAFLYAGARAVVASLWQVADWAAAETMQSFYEGALERGLPPARALREAKLALRNSKAVRGIAAEGSTGATLESGHPFFWAPFIHVGLARSAAQERR